MDSSCQPTPRTLPLDPAQLRPKAGHQSKARLVCRVETSFQDEYREIWDRAALRLGASIYMSYDWTRLWWQFYGSNHLLRVFIFTVENEVVGIVPVCIDCLRVWPLRFRVAKLVGSNIPPKVFNPPVHPEWAGAIFQRILRQLFQEDACDLLSFGPVSALYPPSESLFKACKDESALISHARETSDTVHTIWELPHTLDEFYQSLSRNERKNRKADFKKLEQEHGAKIEVLSSSPEAEAEFENFTRQHAAQWRREGKPGHFGAWPRALEYNRALVDAQAKLGRVRFVRIQSNSGTLASIYAFAFGGSYYCELPARSADPQWNRVSLGPAGIVAAIGAAIAEGMTRLEGGLAHYDYKLRLRATEHRASIVRVVGKKLRSRLSSRFFGGLRLCLLFSYHKLWYQRLAPRLSQERTRSQWPFWLRLDF